MSYNYDELVETITKNRQEYYHPKSKSKSQDDGDDDQQQQQQEHQEGPVAATAATATTASSPSPVDHLQTAVETFETLSMSCPMTPLLWMQYAYDMSNLMKLLVRQGMAGSGTTGEGDIGDNDNDHNDATASAATDAAALEARIQIMELSLNEFPGCAVLHVHYLQLLSSLLKKEKRDGGDDKNQDGNENSNSDIYDETYQQNLERFQQAVETALAQVGRGSHRNEGGLIAKIYRYQAELAVLKSKTQGSTTTIGNDDDGNAAVVQSFVARAMTPMGDANSSLSNEYEMFCQDHKIPVTVAALNEMEDGRRFESKMFSSFVTFEDGVDAAMDQEGVSPSNQINLDSTELDLDEFLQRNDKTCWMGFGGHQSAQAFIRYAQACVRFRSPTSSRKDDDDEDDEMDTDNHSQEENKDPSVAFQTRIKGMASDVYERGIAECPTVETIWLSYIRHLSYQISNDKKTGGGTLKHSNALSKAKSVIDRAVRNCPYSPQIFQHKIRLTLLLANAGRIVLDPEEIMKIVTVEALGLGFITSPEAAIDLSLTVVDVVRKRILIILATEAGVLHPNETATKTKGKKQNAQSDDMILLEYDAPEEIKVSTTPPSISDATAKDMDEDTIQEIEDLATDLRDVYDEIDSLMRKKFVNKGMEGRARLWADRAVTETVILGPLMASLEADGTTGVRSEQMVSEIIRCFDKATKAHKPTNPIIFSSYIHAFLGSFSTISSPVNVIKKIRQTRFLYQTALRSTGKSKNYVAPNTDESDYEIEYESALRSLCHEYMEFERMFGSDRSSGTAAKDIQRKLAKADRDARNGRTTENPLRGDESMSQAEAASNKRNREILEGGISEENPTKKTKMSSEEEVAMDPPTRNSIESSKSTNLKDPKKSTQYKVKVGKLEYPAHPYTVRVSFLSPETDDIDLVDCFRPKCGAVVHAKIMREKQSHHGHHQKPKSKGWGLVQFEERESVEKALALSGEIGVHEKVIKVERSHVAAAGIVPPGMHRIKPKGQGKSTKRNEMRKKHQTDHTKTVDDTKESNSTNESLKSEQDSKESTAAPEVSKPSVLAFRPRGVSSTAKKPKAKISVSSKTTEN
mmetsp:Transcript_52416/g.126869  ORF Transcript_52416/g.126869 Transcript_52416/m.126869 type:complete len:1087 (+) Transcript_52416:116-3376(+)